MCAYVKRIFLHPSAPSTASVRADASHGDEIWGHKLRDKPPLRFAQLCLVVCDHRSRLSMRHQHRRWLCWIQMAGNISLSVRRPHTTNNVNRIEHAAEKIWKPAQQTICSKHEKHEQERKTKQEKKNKQSDRKRETGQHDKIKKKTDKSTDSQQLFMRLATPEQKMDNAILPTSGRQP